MVDYEFIVEEIDECGDIIDVTHHDTYAAAAGERDDLLKTSAYDYHVALVRDAGENREWCYISKHGHNVGFVDAFDKPTGRKLPVKFAKQVADYHK